MMFNFKSQRVLISTLVAGSLVAWSDESEVYDLEPYTVYPIQIANEQPLPTYANPVSMLDFDPRVDLQNRNFAEAQGDISIRGGTFENTGMTLGNLRIFDPQTGHYLAELPIDPQMLGNPEILTGYQGQSGGFNATVGTIGYAWSSIEQSEGNASLSLGENSLNTQSIYQSAVTRSRGIVHGFDVGLARSESDGAIAFGDHDFKRISGRYQMRSEHLSWVVAGGYQDKFFGWPNMYTPFNVQETESIQTLLLLTEATIQISSDQTMSVGGYYRRNTDDYEFDRDRPGLYNPYQHETKVGAAFVEYAVSTNGGGEYLMHLEGAMDSILSTTLTNSFQSRSYISANLEAIYSDLFQGVDAFMHLQYSDTNRDAAMLNPSVRLEYTTSASDRSHSVWYGEITRASQVAGYTAVGSSTSGLFAGNPNLSVERSLQYELGYQFRSGKLSSNTSVFFRQDRDLVDWTFSYNSTNARSANAVDIDTIGFEWQSAYSVERLTIAGSYAYLHKDEHYKDPGVDASFYALNFPNHRATLSFTYRACANLSVQMDNEYRIQEANPLRRSSDNALLSMLSVSFYPRGIDTWTLALAVNNLWDNDYEDVPAVPASPRQFVLHSTIRW